MSDTPKERTTFCLTELSQQQLIECITAHWEDDEWAMTVEHIDVTHVCKLKPPGEPK